MLRSISHIYLTLLTDEYLYKYIFLTKNSCLSQKIDGLYSWTTMLTLLLTNLVDFYNDR